MGTFGEGAARGPLKFRDQKPLKTRRFARPGSLGSLLEEAQGAATGAIDFAQSVIKAGFLLNGGGMVAIPAIVALFNLNASKMLWMLLATGAAFIVGLLATWSASICGFFSLANKSDSIGSAATKVARNLDAVYFPFLRSTDVLAQAKAAEEAEARYRRKFLRYRFVAIVLCFVALAAFIAGVSFGGVAVVKLQPPVSQIRAVGA